MAHWNRLFAGESFYYGLDPGPVARRAVRYHRPVRGLGATPRALDLGCGEGQDALFLCELGYHVTGVDASVAALAKAHRLLAEPLAHDQARLLAGDALDWGPEDDRFDLVLAVNSLQFLGERAPEALQRLQQRVAPGGVLGFSAFARENADEPPLQNGVWRWTLDEVLGAFAPWRPFEAARLWQWSADGASAQPFITLIAGRP